MKNMFDYNSNGAGFAIWKAGQKNVIIQKGYMRYEKFENWQLLDQSIVYKNIDEDDLELLKEKVIPTAKNHFKDSKKYDKIDESILDD